MMRTLKHYSASATVLVVNGDDTTGNLLQDVLAKEGYDVHHAGSAQEMWQVLDQRSVDLILLRLHLTDAFGLDFIPRLAEHPQKPIVIILSGPRDLETAIECTRLGAYDYLTKSVAPGPFLITVEWALTARHIYLKNAVEAMPEGGLLTVEVQHRDHNLEILVTDTGQGIVSTDVSRALEPFFTTKTRGMGLGLTLAKRVFVLHGGSVSLKGTKEGGTAVTLSLPGLVASLDASP